MPARLQDTILIVVSLTAVGTTALPLLDPGLAQGSDVALHVGNVVQCAHLLKSDLPPWDWAPDVAGGYGGPNYLYYGSLGFVLPATLMNLGLPPIFSIKLLIVGTFLIAAVSSFLWCRSTGNRVGAVAGMILFIHNPYFVSLPYVRGAYPEFVACALAPLVLYFAQKWLMSRRPRFLVAGSTVLALVFCTHTLSLILIVPIVILYSLGLGALERYRRAVTDVALLLLLAFLFSAYFLVGPILETDKVEIVNQFDSAELYKSAGIPWYALLNSTPVDNIVVSYVLPGRIYLIAWGVALYFVVTRRDPARRRPALMLTLAFGGILLSEASLSILAVELAPPLRYVQLPWRWLATFNLFVSAAFASLIRGGEGPLPARCQMPTLVVVSLLCVVFSLRTIPGQHATRFFSETIEGIRDSLTTFDHENKYMPLGTKLPDARAPGVLLEAPGGTVVSNRKAPNDYEYFANVPDRTEARFCQYFFDGWRCEVNGKPAKIAPVGELGICGITLPAGQHAIRFWFDPTPIRSIAIGLSVSSGFVATFVLIRDIVLGLRRRN